MSDEIRGRGHHHGNARAALIHAASELLEETGAANLSLRGIAAHAGLSRQAPYNHFADKEALLAALVTAGFDRLADDIRAAASPAGGEEALAAAGEAYIAFAQSAPSLFRLMFGGELVDRARFPDAVTAGGRAFVVMADIVATIAPPTRVADISLASWCIVHGYASLCIEAGLEPPDRRTARARQFARLIAASAAT